MFFGPSLPINSFNKVTEKQLHARRRCQDVNAHVEGVVSAKVGELEERLSGLLSGCAKERCVRKKSDALKKLLARVETRFREEHRALVDVINEQKAMASA